MEKKHVDKWIDPEFGPNEQDKVGASALYFADNEISPGAPLPEDVQWLRPEEILKVLVEGGETFTVTEDGEEKEYTYDDKTAVFMDGGGASANDVK